MDDYTSLLNIQSMYTRTRIQYNYTRQDKYLDNNIVLTTFLKEYNVLRFLITMGR